MLYTYFPTLTSESRSTSKLPAPIKEAILVRHKLPPAPIIRTVEEGTYLIHANLVASPRLERAARRVDPRHRLVSGVHMYHMYIDGSLQPCQEDVFFFPSALCIRFPPPRASPTRSSFAHGSATFLQSRPLPCLRRSLSALYACDKPASVFCRSLAPQTD
jgi:hypothetical protein